jgi:hypothetical protein
LSCDERVEIIVLTEVLNALSVAALLYMIYVSVTTGGKVRWVNRRTLAILDPLPAVIRLSTSSAPVQSMLLALLSSLMRIHSIRHVSSLRLGIAVVVQGKIDMYRFSRSALPYHAIGDGDALDERTSPGFGQSFSQF